MTEEWGRVSFGSVFDEGLMDLRSYLYLRLLLVRDVLLGMVLWNNRSLNFCDKLLGLLGLKCLHSVGFKERIMIYLISLLLDESRRVRVWRLG